jgi:hypothetical protein
MTVEDKKTKSRKVETFIAAGLFVLVFMLFAAVVAKVRSHDSFLEHPALPYEPLAENAIDGALARNENLSSLRQDIILNAVLLNGKVSYFWGGKSGATGMDPEWGQPKTVTAKGDETTGSILPYGLDCSGFINWCFVQAGLSYDDSVSLVGGGTSRQWEKSEAIKWEELRAGDFVFQYKPDEGKGNHVGIVIGFDENGEPVVAHCAYSLGGCVVTGRGDIFIYARRPTVYSRLEGGA